MKKSEDKNWERFVDKAMKEATLESPAADFTDKVMLSIESRQAQQTTVAYQPLISRTTWIVIATITFGLLGWTVVTGTSFELSWIPALNDYFSISTAWEGIKFPSLNYTSLYSLGAFALFVCVQLFVMKRRFDHRFKLH
ncbi:MAG: hypothetical protein KJO94_02605 [Eudoraea sp.]|nr:hypothetical protein [Eudoraea sp.]